MGGGKGGKGMEEKERKHERLGITLLKEEKKGGKKSKSLSTGKKRGKKDR